MLANIPLPQPDQTIESYVAHIFLGSSHSNWKHMMQECFGRPTVKLGRNYFMGLDKFMQTSAGQLFSNNEELIKEHTFTSFFLPFLSEDKRAYLFEKLTQKYPGGINNTLGINSTPIIRDELWFCPHCVKAELKSLGYAYAHRTHQIIGVNACPVHGEPLGPLKNNSPQLFSFRGIINSTSPSVDITTLSARPIGNLSFGKWVHAIFLNQLPSLSHSQRTQLIIDQLERIPRKPNEPSSHPIRLERLIADTYGKGFLSQMGFPITDGLTEHWPALFIWGNAYRNQPIANLLILNALFEKPEQYCAQANNLPTTTQTEQHSPHEKQRPIKFKLTRQLIRDLLSTHSIKEIARANDVGEEEISSFLKVNNAISVRRPDAIHRAAKRRYQKQALDLKAKNPNINRTSLKAKARTCFKWLIKNDKNWLEREFPILLYKQKETFRPKTFHDAHVDAYAANQVDITWKVLVNSNEPLRISKNMLLEKLRQNPILKEIRLNKSPQAASRITDLTETPRMHQKRALKLIAKHAALAEQESALVVAKELVQNYNKIPWLMSELLNLLFETTPLKPEHSIHSKLINRCSPSETAGTLLQ